MNRYPIYHINAFTNQKLGGNPCKVVMNADSLDADLMLRIAKDMNLSETAFVIHSDKADFGARYFTPAEEIPMAGHPTLSTIAALIEHGMINPSKQKRVTLELPAGIFSVDIDQDTSRYLFITMTQNKPKFLSVYDKTLIAAVFGIQKRDIETGVPVQTVSTGVPQLMIPVKTIDVLEKIDIDVKRLTQLRDDGDFFSVHPFCTLNVSGSDTLARHFALPPDVFEDPFTGSATGGMGAYLWHYGLMEKTMFFASQGSFMGRPGKGRVTLLGESDDIQGVQVGGNAVVLYKGEMQL